MTTSPLHAIHQAAQIDHLPDGKPMPPHLSHTLVILASHWPNIWPGVDSLARELHVTERAVQYRLRRLEDMKLIWRVRRKQATTVYRIKGLSPG